MAASICTVVIELAVSGRGQSLAAFMTSINDMELLHRSPARIIEVADGKQAVPLNETSIALSASTSCSFVNHCPIFPAPF